MSKHSLSSVFRSPVQPPPRAKREDDDVLLSFRFKDNITGRQKQQAYNEAQRACTTLFLSVPMATLCNFVVVAQKMATLDREVRCLPHQFHAMQTTACARWAAQLAQRGTWLMGTFCTSQPLQPCTMMMSSHNLFMGFFPISILYILSGFIYIIGGFGCV